MKRHTSSAPPGYSVGKLRRYAEALPTGGQLDILDERAAQAARSVLGGVDPTWEQRLRTQIAVVTAEISHLLDYDQESSHYILTTIELRGVIARAISQASSQCAMNIGQALAAADPLSEQFSEIPDTEVVPDPAYEVPGLQQSF